MPKRKKLSPEEARKREERQQKFIESGGPERRKLILNQWRLWGPNGWPPLFFRPSEDKEVSEAVAAWHALPGPRAFGTGFMLGVLTATSIDKLMKKAEAIPDSPRKRKRGPFREAIEAIVKQVNSRKPERVFLALEDEGLVEDLFQATPRPVISLHGFIVNRERQKVLFTYRDGRDGERSFKTLLNILADS